MIRKIKVFLSICVVSCMCQMFVTVDQCIPDGEYCETHNDCCSNTCLGYASRCSRDPSYYERPSLDRNSLQNLVNGLFASTERPANYNQPPADLGNRFGNEGSVTSPPEYDGEVEATPDQDCKVIGMKCYRDSECCTKKCHGFLHQCVT